MSRVVRAALTETRNAFADMPADLAGLARLAGRMEEVRAANVEHHLGLLAAAAGVGARVVCLGELFPAPYFALHEDPMWFDLAEDAAEGPSVRAVAAAAAAHGLVVIAPIYELHARTGRRFNTAVVIDEAGAVLGKYRKTHVPEGANEAGAFHETFYYERSDGALGNGPADVSENPFFPVFETAVARIGVEICYDRHFPGAVRSLAANGAEIVFSPAVTFGAKSRRLWDLEFAVDAVRHGVYVGGSNRRGAEPPWNVEFFGASGFSGPQGRIDPEPAPEGLLVCDLDLDALTLGDPSGWDLGRDARPDVYSG